MKLLVLAQTPPPLHGQSLMVETLVRGLPAHGMSVHHVNLRLSRTAADIGGWRLGKLLAVLDACLHAIAARIREGCDTLYYIPAPAKRGALYRDWVVMLLCRPFFPRLVLHWHAPGLGDWLATRALPVERWLTRRLLGHADLALVLGRALETDAASLQARRIAVVSNGVADPAASPDSRPPSDPSRPFQVFFLGLCSEEKGLFTAAAAVLAANRATAGAPQPAFTLIAAGPFPDEATYARFEQLRHGHADELHALGPVHGPAKDAWLRRSHCLCLPTRYPAEGQPLVLLEAMAHDLPIIATRWRAIPETVPPGTPLIAPDDVDALARTLVAMRTQLPAPGALRSWFLERYTTQRHLEQLAAALRTLG